MPWTNFLYSEFNERWFYEQCVKNHANCNQVQIYSFIHKTTKYYSMLTDFCKYSLVLATIISRIILFCNLLSKLETLYNDLRGTFPEYNLCLWFIIIIIKLRFLWLCVEKTFPLITIKWSIEAQSSHWVCCERFEEKTYAWKVYKNNCKLKITVALNC